MKPALQTVVLFVWSVAAVAANAVAQQPTELTVRGTEILAGGKPIVLRGLALGDPITGRQDRPLTDYEVIAKDWHANVVRLSIHPGTWKKTSHERVLAVLQENVQAAERNGLYSIICWHTIGWPDGYFQQSPWEPGAYDSSMKLAKEFWDAVAGQFGDDRRVLFELWNEPVFQADDYNPKVGQKWPQFKPFMAELLRVVRARAKDNIVIVTSNRWAYYLNGVKADLLHGENIAYAWHVYAGHSKNDPAQWAMHLDELQAVAPVLVTEWGFQRETNQHFKGSPDTFGKPFVRDFLDGRKLHSTAWIWHPSWGPPMLKPDWRTPNEFGQFVQDYLREANAQQRAAAK